MSETLEEPREGAITSADLPSWTGLVDPSDAVVTLISEENPIATALPLLGTEDVRGRSNQLEWLPIRTDRPIRAPKNISSSTIPVIQFS